MASDGFSELSSYLSSDCSKIEYWRGTTLRSRLGLIQREQNPAINRSRMRKLGARRRE